MSIVATEEVSRLAHAQSLVDIIWGPDIPLAKLSEDVKRDINDALVGVWVEVTVRRRPKKASGAVILRTTFYGFGDEWDGRVTLRFQNLGGYTEDWPTTNIFGLKVLELDRVLCVGCGVWGSASMMTDGPDGPLHTRQCASQRAP